MRKKLTRLLPALLVCCMLTGCSGGEQPPEQTYMFESESDANSQDDENYIAQLTPGKDFYGYINAEKLMKTDLRPTQDVITVLGLIADETKEQTNGIIKDIADSSEVFAPGSDEQLIHDLYWQIYNMVDTGDRDPGGQNTELVESIINRIESVSTKDELIDMWHDLSAEYGFTSALSAGTFNNIFDTREKVLYFDLYTLTDLEETKNNSLRSSMARDDFSSYLKLCGIPADEAKSRATDIIYMYYKIAGFCDPVLLDKDKSYYEKFNILTRAECEGMMNNITYEQLMRSVGYDGKLPEKIAITDPALLKAVDSLMDDEYIRVWKDIALINLLETGSILLPPKYSTSGFDGISAEKTALQYVNLFLERQVAELYAEKYFNAKKRDVIEKMCGDMVREYHTLISSADWLTDEGKAYLIEKLEHIKFFIGADEPHEVDPADAELIGRTLLETSYNFSRIACRKNYADLYSDKPFNGFDMRAPTTANASYVETHNCIVITAAILNKRLFDEDADYGWNLGTIGAVIGHEISHAFDDSGVKFDAYANYRPDAMPKEDIKAFKEIQDRMIKYYSTFKVLGSHVDGKLTLGENLADISGLQCALAIAGDPESQKAVFEGFAESWMVLVTDTYAKDWVASEVHSPYPVRVNAAVALFDEFYDIYGVKEGDPLYVAPEDRIRRW